MTTYKVGQRVRIEWPNGSAVEGLLETDRFGKNLSVVVPRAGVERTWWQPGASVGDGRVVTILSEPRPDEPTGLGAVVEAAVNDDSDEPRPWVLIPRASGQEWHDGIGVCVWDDLIDPVVLSEGWTP